MIDLTETETEYLLYIPASQKERARQIQNRRWDIDRKAWVYPKTKRMYDALLTEFADDLLEIHIQPPSSKSIPTKEPDFQKQNIELKSQLEKIGKTVENLVNTKSSEDKISVFQIKISEQAATIKNLEEEIKNTRQKFRNSILKSEKLTETVKELKSKAGKNSIKTIEDEIVNLAIEGANQDRNFEFIFEEHDLDNTFPIEFCKILEQQLRSMLMTHDQDLSLFDLLSQAKDAELMADEAFDLAHSIRKQRNVLAHQNIDPNTRRMRLIYVLAASSLLWPHLSA